MCNRPFLLWIGCFTSASEQALLVAAFVCSFRLLINYVSLCTYSLCFHWIWVCDQILVRRRILFTSWFYRWPVWTCIGQMLSIFNSSACNFQYAAIALLRAYECMRWLTGHQHIHDLFQRVPPPSPSFFRQLHVICNIRNVQFACRTRLFLSLFWLFVSTCKIPCDRCATVHPATKDVLPMHKNLLRNLANAQSIALKLIS